LVGLSDVLGVSTDELLRPSRSDSQPIEFEIPGIVDPHGRALRSSDPAYQRVEMSVSAVRAELIARLAQAPHLMREIHWRDFEQRVADLFARDGFDVELTPRSGDEGVDLFAARRTGLGRLLSVVEAKQWASIGRSVRMSC
jgi:hypothetical protein